MKFMIDSSNEMKVKKILDLKITDALTTNPTILQKENMNRKDQLLALKKLTNQRLFVQLTGLSSDHLVEDYKQLVKFFKDNHIEYGIKIAIDQQGLEAIARIKDINKDEIILATTLYSSHQAILAVMAGCQYLAPYYNRMIKEGIDPNEMIAQTRRFIDDHHYDCTIVAASLKSPEQVVDALMNGAHTCTLDPDLLEEMFSNEFVRRDLEVFEDHHKQFNR